MEPFTSDNFQSTDTLQIIAESESFFKKGKLFYDKEEYAAAIDYFLKSDSVINAHFDEDCPYSGYGKTWASYCYHKLGQDSIALEYSIYYDMQPIDKLLTHSSDSVIWLALRLIDVGQIKNAAEKLFEATLMEKQELGPNSYWYANTLSLCSALYRDIGNFGKAIELGKDAIEIYRKTFGTNHPDYASCLYSLATCYAGEGNAFLAIQLGKEVLDIEKGLYGTENSNYADDLSNLAVYYSAVGNYNEALRLGTQSMNIRKRLLGNMHPDYAISLINLADDYSAVGNYSDALQFGTEAMDIWEKNNGSSNPDYATALSHLASYYSDLGNNNKALLFEAKALKIRKEVLGIEHPFYLTSLSNYALYNSYVGNFSEAILIGNEVLELEENVYGLEHPAYAISMACLARYYSNIGNFVEAQRLSIKALEILQKVYGIEHPIYAKILSSLATYYANLGHSSEALIEGKKALKVLEKVFGIKHPNYSLSLSNIALFYTQIGNYAEAYGYMKQYINNTCPYILKCFVELSSNLRESLWREKFSSLYISLFPGIVEKNQNKEAISELYDKTCLFAKGILLNTDIEVRNLIYESSDSSLISKYDNLISNIRIYNKLIITPNDKRFIDVDSLDREIEQVAMELARESKAYGDYTNNLTISWKDVQKRLDDNDIAIEFIEFPILGSDSTIYAALTLKKSYDSPHMVMLFEKEQLNAIPDSTYYTQKRIYDLVWKPLEEELENIHNIFFSPSGDLHRIGIEYIPINKTDKICDKYSLHRLSSTRQLAFDQNGTKGEQTVLYGGIDYNTHERQEEHDGLTMPVGTAIGNKVLSRSNVDSLSLRSSIDYLEGTKMEADRIADQMKQHQIHFLYYSGANGSEESFKRLDGTKPKVIHIATHGFYLTESEAKQSKIVRPYIGLTTEDNYRFGHYVEDKSMTRSGLLFSGCNHAINHEHIPEGVEDGILTAQEISNLDLRGLDLVVLSACQTALGEITSGEGVFGLQRGFKKAGAQTIIMSLWKVDDEATMKLMTSFYHHYLEGMTKEKAFRKAQNELRQVSPSMQTKPDWASFIMLDGIN